MKVGHRVLHTNHHGLTATTSSPHASLHAAVISSAKILHCSLHQLDCIQLKPHITQDDNTTHIKLEVLHSGLDAQSVLQKFGKGKPIPAIIEAVSGGANLKATLLPDHYFVNINLVGVSCPSMNRRPQGAAPPPAAPAANGDAPAAAAEAAEPEKNSTVGTSSAEGTAAVACT